MKRRTLVLVLLMGWQSFASGEVRYRVVRINPPEPPGLLGVRPGVMSMGGVDINNRGEIVGEYTWCRDAGCHTQGISGFIYSDRSGSRGFNVPGYAFNWPAAINDSGQVALTARRDRSIYYIETFRFTPEVGFDLIEGFPGDETYARDINAHGQVTGDSGTLGTAFRYNPDGSTDSIPGLFGFGSGGFAINDQGWVAGGSAEHAFLYRDDHGMTDLGPGIAYDINNAGAVVGSHFFEPGNPIGPEEACLWEPDGTLRLLGRWAGPFGGGRNAAYGLNNFKIVVGHVWDGPLHATIWSEAEGMLALETLIEPGPSEDPTARWSLWTANAINDRGQIVCSGSFTNATWTNSPFAVTYRLDPIPPRLVIERTVTNMMVRWAPAWPGLVLESSASLSTPDWQPVATGGTNVVNVSASRPQRFYRLNLDSIRGLCCAPE